MQSPYVDFINHGILPFVGRAGYAARIFGFWESTAETHQVRAMLVTGEAGIGKSRLVEEIIPQIVQAGGAIVHTKLYPESTTSIAPLLARALRFMNMRRTLLLNDPEETLPSVAGALRRLSHLRRTMLVIEDIHLLSGETLGELSMLLDSIADEPLLTLCMARPLGMSTRGVLERYLVDEIELKGLDEQCLATLWQTLFSTPLAPEAIRQIVQATTGNPLALRSVLRGAIKLGALTRDTATNTWRPTLDAASFRKSLARNVELLSEGMAAHLNAEEKDAAEKLAPLGELFAREAARAMLSNADELIDGLLFKGILIASNTGAPPLPGTTGSVTPLAFTHTLLHRRFIEQGGVDHRKLMEIIAEGLPLYSVLPFQAITRYNAETPSPLEQIESVIGRSFQVARALDSTADWMLSMSILEAAAHLIERNLDRWNELDALEWRLRLLMQKLALLRREEAGEAYGAVVDEMARLTDAPLPDHLRKYQLLALVYLDIHYVRRTARAHPQTRQRIDMMVKEFPPLRFTQGYLFYLIQLAHTSSRDPAVVRMIEEQVDTIIKSPDADEEFRREVRFRIFPAMLLAFDTREQLESRIEFLREFETISRSYNLFNDRTLIMHFLVSIGRLDEALAIIDELLPRLSERGLTRSYGSCLVNKLCINMALGLEVPSAPAEIDRYCAAVPPDFRISLRETAVAHLTRLAILRNNPEWARAVATSIDNGETPAPFPMRLIDVMDRQGREGLRAVLQNEQEHQTALHDIARMVLDPKADAVASLAQTADALLRRELLRFDDLIHVRGVITLIDIAEQSPETSGVKEKTREAARIAVTASLAWLAERRLPLFMPPILNRFGDLLTTAERTIWREEFERLEAIRNEEFNRKPRPKDIALKISMIGAIEAERSNGEKLPIRGSRLRALLGLMVADGILEEPLAYREFSSIIAGVDDDPDRARRMVNGIVFRLRELLGHQAILTDTETPRLNLDCVQVDMFEAHMLLKKAAESMQNESLVRAQHALIDALDLTHGNVPFPTLYDNFFEAVREDFENHQRDLILKVSRGLLLEGDPKSAEQVLLRGFRAIPDDEEIADLLCDTLIKLGKRAQSERIRMRSQDTITA